MKSTKLGTATALPYDLTISPSTVSTLSDNTIMFVRALATNSGNSAAYSSTVFQAILRVNNAPTDIALSVSSIAENNQVGSVIGILSTTDADANQAHTYSVVSNPSNAFAISGSSLTANIVFDYESQSSYTVRIRSSDPYAYVEKDFGITVTNVNEAPYNLQPWNVTIPEDRQTLAQNPGQSPIVTFTASDPDNDGLQYLLSSSGFNKFILFTDGTFFLQGSLDYESTPSYTLSITARDPGSLTTVHTVAVTVTDVNEPPTDITLGCSGGVCIVPEFSAIGTIVGNLTAKDPDAGNTHTFR